MHLDRGRKTHHHLVGNVFDQWKRADDQLFPLLGGHDNSLFIIVSQLAAPTWPFRSRMESGGLRELADHS